MKIKETVQKAMLTNSTKDEMYKEICDKLNCSRHAAKVLVHCFIWECSEAYMQYVAFESSHLLGDVEVGEKLKEPEMKTVPKVGNVYSLKDFKTGKIVAKGVVEFVYHDGKYLLKIFEYDSRYTHLCGLTFLVTEEDLIKNNNNNKFAVPDYQVLR
ncbi:hypothetical protein SP3_81 [Salmonella phage SP3_SHan-2021]|uniref:Uncharacterized protein n=1 Tax=Salmonella phage SP3_SHan-2021 TaxID=2803186 RepID=A0A7T5QU53_9CAUD|nr:hypothetical protein SP3_81 [Salmonella phage SP3_SHan-2021]